MDIIENPKRFEGDEYKFYLDYDPFKGDGFALVDKALRGKKFYFDYENRRLYLASRKTAVLIWGLLNL